MSNTKIWTASPSRLGLPGYGRTSGIEVAPIGTHLASANGQTSETDFRCVERTGRGVDVTVMLATTAVLKGAFPGITAWSPPIC